MDPESFNRKCFLEFFTSCKNELSYELTITVTPDFHKENYKIMYNKIHDIPLSRHHKQYKKHGEKRKEKKTLEKNEITKLFLFFHQLYLDVSAYFALTPKIYIYIFAGGTKQQKNNYPTC